MIKRKRLLWWENQRKEQQRHRNSSMAGTILFFSLNASRFVPQLAFISIFHACPPSTSPRWLAHFTQAMFLPLRLFFCRDLTSQKTRPDIWPISSRLRVGRGSNMSRRGQYVGGRGLWCGWAGAVMLKDRHFSRYRVVQVFAFPTFLHT